MAAACSFRFALVAIALAGAAITSVTAPAAAQSFFGFFRHPHAAVPPSSNASQDRGSFLDDLLGIFRGFETERIEGKDGSGVYANYCVRTCDGKFFPVNGGRHGEGALDKVCKAMCPAAETKIYRGAGIESAKAGDGKEYTALPTAFAYRNGIADNCTCNGRDPFGVVNVDISQDPTLRGGDIVVRPKDVVVFQNGPAAHESGNFTPVENAKNVSATIRKQISVIRILQDNPHAAYAKTMPVLNAAEAAAQNHPHQVFSPEDLSPNANAPAAEPPARTK